VTVRVSLTERVRIESGGAVVDEPRFPGRQGRLVFAYLLAAQARPVPRDELAEALWGDEPPATWEKALSVLVSKVRALLTECGLDGSALLTSAFGCYQLSLPAGTWIDVVAADEAATAAERALAMGELDQARADASAAESLARRTFLPGEDGRWVEDERARLRETLVRALDCLAEVNRLSGDPSAAIRAAEQLIVLDPFRETGYRRLMEAHVAAGNRAEALRVYERCRRLLAEELGAYPSPETESIYRGLLEAPASPRGATDAPEVFPRDADAVADAERATTNAGARRTMRKRVAVVTLAVIGLVAAFAGTFLARSTREPPSIGAAANSIVALDPSGAIAATVPVGARPVAITSGAGALWVANLDDQSVTRVDGLSQRAVRTIPIGDTPTGIAATETAVWVTDGSGGVSKVDPRYDRRLFTRPLRASVGFFGGTARPALAAFGSIWIVSPDGVVLRIDPRSAQVVESVAVGNASSAIASGAGSLWVTNSLDGTVTRIDPSTLAARTIPVGNGPASVAVNAAGAWIANAGDNALVRVDLQTNAVVDTTPVGDGPAAVLATPAALWVANGRDGTVMRLDPRSGELSKMIRLGGTPTALAVAGGRVWIAIAPSPPQSPPAGGARLTTRDDFTSLDPASGLWLLYTTCANLVTYPDKPAPQGSRIIPEVAAAVPDPTAGGTLYTFRIRRGFRFSPPSNEMVTAMTFKATIERVTDPRMKSPLASAFSRTVGYRAYVAGKARGIAGIVARGDTLMIRLSRPDGGFLERIAGGYACAVPRDTPVARGMNNIPSAGPYYIASYTPRQQLVLRRNPNYEGSRPHRLGRIVLAIGVDPVDGLEQVEAGTADYALELPREAAPRLETAYGPRSEAATAGHQQYFISQALGARVLHMNTSRPLFSDARLRRAVNYAIDRSALAAQGRRAAEGNPFNAGAPTDDFLPPSAAGATDFDIYPVDHPDLGRARRIAGRVHATAIMYTPNLSPWREEAQIVRRNLMPLGIDVQVKEFPIANFFTRVTRPGEPFDLAVSGYGFSPDPVLDLALLFAAPTNISHFHDATVSRKLEAIAKLSGAKRYRAASRLALELQRDVVPAAAFATTASRDFFSARIGCHVYQPVWGMDIAALCLR
jgi:YVTN family beta-propeller protein